MPICIHVHKRPELCDSIHFEDMAFSCDDSFEFGLPPIPSTPEQKFSPSVNIGNVLQIFCDRYHLLNGRQILYNFMVSLPTISRKAAIFKKDDFSKASSCTLLIYNLTILHFHHHRELRSIVLYSNQEMKGFVQRR